MPTDVKNKNNDSREQMILMGNEAPARGMIDSGSTIVASLSGHPGLGGPLFCGSIRQTSTV